MTYVLRTLPSIPFIFYPTRFDAGTLLDRLGGVIELLVQFGEFRFGVFRGDILHSSRSASQSDERIAAAEDVEKFVHVGLKATLTDAGTPT
jgi:hypothetical protein